MKRSLFAGLALVSTLTAQDSPLPVAELQRNTPVDFAKEIVPFLKKNCLACHNEKKAKADLNLESPQAMIAGGDSGPSLVPGKPMESLVFTYSVHLEDDPMPPEKNKSNAVNLNPEELALLKLWITQGGIGSSSAVLPGPSEWQDLQGDNAIYATAISDDGRFVAAGRGNRIHLYDLHRGSLEAELHDPELEPQTAHRDNIHSLAFNRDGVLASGGFRTVKLWSRDHDIPAPVSKSLPEASTSRDREWIVSGNSIQIEDIEGKQPRQINHGSPITAFSVHATANRIATAGADGIVRVWDATKGTKLGELKGDREFEVLRAAAARKRDVSKRVADLRRAQVAATEKRWNELREHSKKQAEAQSTALKDLDSKEAVVRKLRKESDLLQKEVSQIEKSPDKSSLGAVQGRAKKTSDALKKAETEHTASRRKHIGAQQNRELAVRDGGKAAENFLAAQTASIEADGQLASAEESVKSLEEQAKTIEPGAIRSLAISADGTTLAAGTEKMGIQLWSVATLQALDTIQKGRDTSNVAFTPQGDLIATFADKSLAHFAPASWHKSRQFGDGSNADSFPGRVLALDFHPRGNILATGSGIPSRHGEIKLWNIHDGSMQTEIVKPHVDTITALAFSPDGSQIASSSTDQLIKLHRLDTGARLHTLEGHTNQVLDVAWSADGQTIATAGADKLTKLWNAETGKQTKSEGGYRKEITSIEFLGTGNTLLTSSGDTIVKAAKQNLGGITGFVYTATSSPDGQLIAAGGEDGILRIWRAKDRKLIHSFPPPTITKP